MNETAGGLEAIKDAGIRERLTSIGRHVKDRDGVVLIGEIVDFDEVDDLGGRPSKSVLVEHSISRHGGWSVDRPRPVRAETKTSIALQMTIEDVLGTTTITYALGEPLSTEDFQMAGWVMTRWSEAGQGRQVSFGIVELIEAMGLKTGGSQYSQIKSALRRIRRTHFTATVWDQKSHKHVEKDFSIFDELTVKERRRSREGPALEAGTTSITLSEFMIDQIKGGQYTKLNWQIWRHEIKGNLARKLYAFVSSHDGFPHGLKQRRYEITIDQKLKNTLGSNDRNKSRFLGNLRSAVEEIMKADSDWQISIRQGAKNKTYVLQAVRSESALGRGRVPALAN